MFSTIFTQTLQLKRRTYLFVATLLTTMIGIGVAPAQLLENEFHSPLSVTESKSVLFDTGLVEMQVDDALLQEMSTTAGEILIKDFPVNEYETVDLVVEQFFPYKGNIGEPYFEIDESGNRVARRRPIHITAKCFRGRVVGFPESTVVFGMNKEMCNGFIQYADTTHTLSTDPATGVIAVSDPLAEQPGLQMVREMMREAVAKNERNLESQPLFGGGGPPPEGCAQISLSVVYGGDFLGLFGGTGNQQAAADYVVTLIGQVSTIFRRDGVAWVEVQVQDIADGSGFVDGQGTLAGELCNFVDVTVGTQIPDVTVTGPGTPHSDAYLILRTTATGSVVVANADNTKQSLSFFKGLTTGINASGPPPLPPDCPATTAISAVGAASGLIGGNDMTGYDTYIVSQALGTLCGAAPTGQTPNITALWFNGLGVAASGAGTQLGFDNCDGGAIGVGTIMSSCYLPNNSMAGIVSSFNTTNTVLMNAYIAAPTTPLVNATANATIKVISSVVPADLFLQTFTVTDSLGVAITYTFQDVAPDGGGTSPLINIQGLTAQLIADEISLCINAAPGGSNIVATANPVPADVFGDFPITLTQGTFGASGNTTIITNVSPVDIVFSSAFIGGGNLAPAPVTDLVATTGEAAFPCNQILLNWTSDPGAATETVYRNTENVFTSAVLMIELAGGTGTWIDTGAEGGQVYFYWVVNTNACNDGITLIADQYNPDIMQPFPAPANTPGVGVRGTLGNSPPEIPIVTATVFESCSTITVTWDLENEFGGYVGADSVEIWRSELPVFDLATADLVITDLPINPNLYIDDGSTVDNPTMTLVGGTVYYYWVTPFNTACTAPVDPVLGGSAAGIIQENLNGITMRLGATNGSLCEGVQLSWQPIPSLLGTEDVYQITKRETVIGVVISTFNLNTVDDDGVPITTYLDLLVDPGVSYSYTIQAIPGDVTCNPSAIQLDFAEGMTGKVESPVNVQVIKSGTGEPNAPACGDIRIEWDEVNRADFYEVWRATTPVWDDVIEENNLGSTTNQSFIDSPPVTGQIYYYWITSGRTDCPRTAVPADGDQSVVVFGSVESILVQPTNLIASKSTLCDRIRIQWDGAFDGTTYTVYRNTVDDFNDVDTINRGTIDDLGFFDDPQDAVAGDDPVELTIYYYWVEANNNCGTTQASDSDAGVIGDILLPPVGLNATEASSCNSVTVSWVPRILASSYRVYRHILDVSADAELIADLDSSNFMYADNAAVPGVSYFYWVEAVNICSNGDAPVFGDSVTGLNGSLVGPSGMSATDGENCGFVEINWDEVPLANEYVVHRGEVDDFNDPSTFQFPAITSTTFQDGTVVDKTLYYYWVTTNTSFCDGDDLSASVTGWAITDLAVVTNVSSGQGTECSNLIVTWDPVTNVEEYEIFRNTTGDTPVGGDSIGFPTESVFVDDDPLLVAGIQYYYWVQATTSCGIGEFSDESIGYLADDLDPPTFVGQSDSGNCTDITIGWVVVDGADDYSIYKNTSDQFSSASLLAQNITTTQFTDVAVTEGQTFFYWVLANNACGLSGESTSAQAANTTLDNPSVVTTETGCGEVTVSWNSITGASGYSVYRTDADIAPVPGVDIPIDITFGVGATTSVDMTAVPQTLYYYWVVTDNDVCQTLPGMSTAGAAVAQPVAPDGLDSTNGDCGAVTVSWTDFAWDVTYHVYRNTTGIPPTPDEGATAEDSVTASPFVDATALDDGTLYYYWVTSATECDGGTESGVGARSEGMSAVADPLAPDSVTVTDGVSCDSITVQWTPVLGVDDYVIYRSEGGFAESSFVGSVTQDQTSFEDDTPLDGVSYNYWVVGSNDCGESANVSSSDSGFTGTLVNPENIITTSVCGGVELAWDAVDNNNGYQVYRGIDSQNATVDLGFANTANFIDTTGDPKVPYYYFITTHNGACEGATTVGEFGISMPEATVVQGVNATNVSCDTIELDWTAETWAAPYTVWRNIDNVFGTPGAEVAVDIGTTFDAIFTDIGTVGGLVANTQYYYWVTTDHACGQSPASAVASAISEVPQIGGVAATIGTYCEFVEVSWTDLGENTTYHVWRNTVDDPLNADEVTDVALFPLNTVSTFSPFQDYEALADGTEYYYWVTAEPDACVGSEGEFSNSMFGRRASTPDAPSNVVATLGTTCASVDLQWSGVEFVDTYRIFRADGVGATWAEAVEIDTVIPPNAVYSDVTAAETTQYTYWVVSETACGESATVDGDGVLGYSGELANPIVTTDAQQCGAVTMTWNEVTGASGYSVYRTDADIAPVPGVDIPIDITFGVGATTSVDMTAVPQTLYYYWVVTDNDVCQTLPGMSTAGAAVAQPVAPDGLDSTNGDCGAVTVSWTDFAWDVTYHVYRNTTGIPPTPDEGATAEDSVTASPFVDATALDDGTLYYYWVTSATECDGGTESGVGARSEGMSAVADPLAPDSVTVTDGVSCDSITVQWTPVLGVDDYVIYRSEGGFAESSFVGSVTQDQTSFEDDTPLDGVSYNYWVVGSNDCGESANVSSSDSGFTGTLVNPENIITTSVCGGVELAWDAVDNNNGYQVYRGIDSQNATVDLGFANTANFIDTTGDPKVPYYYFITTHNGACEGATTVGEFGISMPEATVVQGVNATNVSCDTIELDWTAETWAAPYTVWRNIDNVFGTPGAEVAVDIGTTFDAIFTDIGTVGGLVANTQYYYWVTTDHACGQSPASAVASAISEVPQVASVAASVGADCEFVEVSWADLGENTTYHVWRSTVNDPLNADEVTDVALFPLNTVSTFSPFRDYEASSDGTQYYYWVTAEPDACGAEQGEYSNSSFGRRATSPVNPADVVASQGTVCGAVELQWSGVELVDQYRIYRANGDAAVWADATEIGVVVSPSTLFVDNAADEGLEYSYWITSETVCGEGTVGVDGTIGYSSQLANPVVTSISQGLCSIVEIEWDVVEGVDDYHIYRSQYPDPQVPVPAIPVGTTVNNFFTDESAPVDVDSYYWVRSVTQPSNCVSGWGVYSIGSALASPVIPQNVTAGFEDQCEEVLLSWEAGSGVNTTYHVFRLLEDLSGDSVEIDTTQATYYTDNTVVQGETYYYWIKSETSGSAVCGMSEFTDTVVGQTAIAPVAPEFVNATDMGTSAFCDWVEVSWQPDASATSYTVWRSTGLIGEASPLDTTPNITFDDTSALAGTVYSYWVTSNNACADGLIVDADTPNTGSLGQLLPPTGVVATEDTAACGQIDISWTSVDDAYGYFVYRSETSDFADAILIGSADGEAYTDFSPPVYDTQLYYFVSSLAICNDATNLPDLHSPAEAGSARAALTTPTDVNATFGTACSEIVLQWTGASSDYYYDIYRNTTGVTPTIGGVDLLPAGTDYPETTFVDSTAVDATQYYYWVLADNSCGESNLSVNTIGTTAETLDSPTIDVTEGSVCDSVDVSWNEIPTATIYHIYRNEEDVAAGAQEVAFVLSGTSVWQDVTALAGESYFYWVRAENDCGLSSIADDGLEGWSGELLAPPSVDATDDLCGFATINWSAVTGAVSYGVYRNQANDWATATFAGSTSLTTFDDVDLLAAVPYYYWVTSESSTCGEGEPSAAVIGSTSQGVEIPTSLSATYRTSCGEVVITWSHPGNGTTFTVKRHTSDNVGDATSISIGGTDQQYVDTPPSNNTSYFYWVEANNGCGDSNASEYSVGQSVGVVSETTGLTASDGLGCASIDLAWTPVEGADGYNIYRSTTEDFSTAGAPIGITTQDVVAFEDFTAANGVTYHYWVLAENVCGERVVDGDDSDEGFTGTLDNPTGVATSNDPNDVQCGQVLIMWDPVDGNTGYFVYRSTDPNAVNPGLLGASTDNSYVDTTADVKIPYYYFVATDHNGCIDIPNNSEQGMAFPFASAVQNVFANNNSCSSILLSWTAEPWAAPYTITRSETNVYDVDAPSLATTFESTYVDESVDPNTQYYYWVTTFHPSCLTSPASDVATASTTVPVVTDVAATIGECERVDISWTEVVGQAAYHIYRNTVDEPTGATEVLDSPSLGSPFEDTSGDSGTQYYYWVTAALADCNDEEGLKSGVAIGQSAPVLSTPENVFASQGSLCGEIFIQWTANELADTFEIWRSDDLVPVFTDAQLVGTANGTGSSYSDISVLPSTSYNYWVVALNNCGSSETENADGVIGFVGELSNPVNFIATDNLCGNVALSWDAVDAADSYILTQSTTDNFTTSTVVYTGTDTNYELAATPDEQFYYWVQTENNGCTTDAGSSESGMALAITEIPTNVQASPESLCGAIEVTWDGSGQQAATTYRVYRATVNTFPGGAPVDTTVDTSFVDTDVVAGSIYYYWITGENSCSTSPESLVASGVPGEVADQPTNVVASDSGASWFCNQVVISWLASPTADSYMVYRSQTGVFAEAEMIADDVTVTGYIDDSAMPTVEYTYWVLSVTSCGPNMTVDANFNVGSVGQLPPPINLVATEAIDPTSNCGSVVLSWEARDGATGYTVYRSTTPIFPGDDGVIGLAQGETYIDSNLSAGLYDIPLYYWLDSLSEFCNDPDTQSTVAQGSASPPLIIPEGLQASQGTVCGEIWLQWVATPNALSYEIYRNTVESFPEGDVPIDTSTTNFFADTVLTGTYFYWVKAVNTCGTTTYSVGDSGYPSDGDLTAPSASATQGTICNSIDLAWGAVLSADRYFIERSLDADGLFREDVATVISPITAWSDFDTDPGRNYYYWVTAQNDCGMGVESNRLTGWLGELPAPSNVIASDTDGGFCGSIVITWDEVNDAVDYNIYRNIVGDDDEPTLIGSSGGSTTFIDFSVNASLQYYYWVKSINNTICGESDFSASDVGQSLPPVVIPSNVSATYNEQCEQITVTWDHDAELTTFKLYRHITDDFASAGDPVATNILDTLFVDSPSSTAGFENGVAYFYWVTADNVCGESNSSSPAALGLATETILDPPEDLFVTPHCVSINISWSSVVNATKYQLKRYTDATPGSPGTLLFEGNQVSYTDSDVVSGVSYFYEVVAVNPCSTSDATDLVESSASAPLPPTEVSATDASSNCQIEVTWNWVGPSATFRIYRSTDADSANAQFVGTSPSGSGSEEDPWIDYEPLASAYYFVKAITVECGEGSFSTGDIGSPDQGLSNPANVAASNGTHCDGVQITWDPVGDATSYCIYRGDSEAPQNAIQLICGVGVTEQIWVDTTVSPNTPYWYWVTSEASGAESCSLGSPDQGWPSEPVGIVHDLDATICNPDYVVITWWGTDICYDVARTPMPQTPSSTNIIAECVQSPYIDSTASTYAYYYVRPVTACGEVGDDWEGPVFGNPTNCEGFGEDLPEGLLGTDPGDPTILIVPSDLGNSGKPHAKGSNGKHATDLGNGESASEKRLIDSMPPWSLCLVGDAEITTDPTFILGDTRWSLPLGGNWRLVGHEGYADLFFLGGSDWEHVRSLKVKEIESGVASTLLEDGIAAVVGTVPEAGSNVLITGVSSDDCDNDGVPDGCEILLGISLDMNIDGIPDSCAADLNGDGVVDSFDLIEVLQHFGAPVNEYGDVNSDGIVDQSDVLSILMEM